MTQEDWERVAQRESFWLGLEQEWRRKKEYKEIMEEVGGFFNENEQRKSVIVGTIKQARITNFNDYGKSTSGRRKNSNRAIRNKAQSVSSLGSGKNNKRSRNTRGM